MVMKGEIKLLICSCLFLANLSMQGIEKKILFKKKICATKARTARKVSTGTASDNYITVWIHGVNLFKPNEYNLGLWPAHTFVGNESLFNLGKYLVESDPQRFPAENVLVYSWAGKFDFKECERAAERLYDALVKTVNEYRAQNKCKPKIRIITFSYGGNIVFNLPKFKKPRNNLVIDELIVLAWPVQHCLVSMAHDKMFKKIFNLYSPLDFVQIMDPQEFCERSGAAPLFSSRRLKRGDNILQTRVHINGRGRGHFALCDRRVLSVFPMILDELNDWFCYAQDHNLGLKKTRYMLSIYTDKSKSHKY